MSKLTRKMIGAVLLVVGLFIFSGQQEVQAESGKLCVVLCGVPQPPPFVNDGSSFPWSQPDLQPSSFYNSSSAFYTFCWEGYQPVNGAKQRVAEVSTYTPSTQTWAGNFLAGVTTLSNDLHGVPTCLQDADGYYWIFYGAHTSAIQISRSYTANDPTRWVAVTALNVTATFPKPFLVGTKIYLFYSSNHSGGEVEATETVVVGTVSGSGTTRTISWGTPKTLFDFVSSDILPGTALIDGNGTSIDLVFDKAQLGNPTTGQDVFYASYDTVTGNVSNFGGGTTVVPASQPISLATAQASFRIVDQTDSSLWGGQPVMAFTTGCTHIGYPNSTSNTGSAPTSILHTVNCGSGWSAPFTIFTYTVTQPINAVGWAIVPNAAGGVYTDFPDGTFNASLTDGNMLRRTRDSGGNWSGSTLLQKTKGFGLINAAQIVGSPTHGDIWTAVSSDEVTIAGNLPGYFHDDSGFISRAGIGPYSPSVPAGTSTLDPANTSANITLSGSNLIGTNNHTNGPGNVSRVTASHSSGRYYAEFTINNKPSSNSIAIGIINGTQALTNHFLGETGNNSIGMFDSSNIFINGSSGGTAGVAYTTGDVIDIAADFDFQKVWWRKNCGAWVAGTGALPNLNITGRSISGLTGPAFYFAIELDALNAQVTANLGATAYSCPAPAGFLNP